MRRIALAASLESRDGTLARDARMKNTLRESIDGEAWAVKRPGVANAMDSAAGLVPGQGMIELNGKVYAVFGDTLYNTDASAIGTGSGWGGSGGGGGGSSGWVQI